MDDLGVPLFLETPISNQQTKGGLCSEKSVKPSFAQMPPTTMTSSPFSRKAGLVCNIKHVRNCHWGLHKVQPIVDPPEIWKISESCRRYSTHTTILGSFNLKKRNLCRLQSCACIPMEFDLIYPSHLKCFPGDWSLQKKLLPKWFSLITSSKKKRPVVVSTVTGVSVGDDYCAIFNNDIN